MAGFFFWVQNNWTEVVAAVGIIVGSYFTAASFRQKANKEVKNDEETLTQQHKELWSGARERSELKRIFQTKVDLKAAPITTAELVFLNSVFIHYERGWEAAQKNTFLTMETYLADVRWFFAHPFPRAVWKKTKRSRNPKFVRFINRAIERRGRL